MKVTDGRRNVTYEAPESDNELLPEWHTLWYTEGLPRPNDSYRGDRPETLDTDIPPMVDSEDA